MTVLSTVKAILEADTTLLAAASGGVWDAAETGPDGINRTSTTAAFDSNLVIKPCVFLKLRSSVPDYILADDENQYVSVREMIEVWCYQNSGYATIETMRLRIYALLHAKQLAGTFAVRWQGDIQPFRDIDLKANGLRSDYLAVVKRSV